MAAVLCCGAVVLVVCIAKYERTSSAVVFALAMIAAMAPWLLTRFVSGAPFTIPVTGAQSAPETGLTAFLKFPWNLVMRPHWYGGWQTAAGGLLLILGIPGFFAGGRLTRWLAAFAVLCGIPLYFLDRSHVSFLPLATILLAVAAVGACKLKTLRPLVAVALTALFVQGLFVNGWTALDTKNAGLSQRVPRYEAIRWVNENLPKGSRILTPEPYHYFFDMPTYRNLEAVAQLEAAGHAAMREWLRANDIGYFVFPETWVRAHRDALPPAAVNVFNRWRADESVFTKIQVLRVPARDGNGVEQVEIYEARNDKGNGA